MIRRRKLEQSVQEQGGGIIMPNFKEITQTPRGAATKRKTTYR